jgi:hypothetical protein
VQLLDELATKPRCALVGALERHRHECGIRAKASGVVRVTREVSRIHGHNREPAVSRTHDLARDHEARTVGSHVPDRNKNVLQQAAG